MSILPLSSFTLTSDLNLRISAFLLMLEVPIIAFLGSEFKSLKGPTITSLAVSLFGIAANTMPLGRSTGRSFKE